jgi:hypothetical protein
VEEIAMPNSEPLPSDDVPEIEDSQPLSKIPTTDPPAAKPGSKEAVLKHFGVFKDDADMEEQLAILRAIREASGE